MKGMDMPADVIRTPGAGRAMAELYVTGAILALAVLSNGAFSNTFDSFLGNRLHLTYQYVIPLRMLPSNLILLTASFLWLCWIPMTECPLPGFGSWRGQGLVLYVLYLSIILAFAIIPASLGAPEIVIKAIVLVSAVPLAEEYFFRGVLLDHLIRNTNRYWGAALSSMLFAGMHLMQSPGAFFSTLFLGLAASTAVIYGRSLFWTIGVHVIWNTIAAYQPYFMKPGDFIMVLMASSLVLVFTILGAWNDNARKQLKGESGVALSA